MSRDIRKVINSKEQPQTFSKGTPSSIPEGGVYITNESGKLAVYRQHQGMKWKNYMSRDGNQYVDKDLSISGNVKVSQNLDITNGYISLNDGSPDSLVCINQGAYDDAVVTLKSSDVAHGMTDVNETDTYGMIDKVHDSAGGLRIRGLRDTAGNSHSATVIEGYLGENSDTTKNAGGYGVIRLTAKVKSGTDVGAVNADGNLLSVDNNLSTKFLVDEDGDIFYDGSAAAYDSYEDSMLVRTMDTVMAPKEIIQNEFDKYIKYNKKTLEDAGLLGKGKDPLVCLTGMQRLHNGAIWQQYTEMQKIKNVLYETMVELVGENKANKKLEEHGIKMLSVA